MLTELRLPFAASAASIVLSSTILVAQGFPPAGPVAQPVSQSTPAVPAGQASGQANARQALISACRSELQSLCGNVERGGGRKLQCLKDNESKLGGDCRSAIGKIVAGAQGGSNGVDRARVKQACGGDIVTLCGAVEKGKGGIGRCLRENESKLSQPCAAVVADQKAKMKELRQAIRQACSADAQALCGDRTTGKPILCLREKQAQTSPGCRQVLSQLPARRTSVQRNDASQVERNYNSAATIAPAPAQTDKNSDDAVIDLELDEAAPASPAR